jgi:hypothetical protein
MNDGLDDLHSEREEGFWPSVGQVARLVVVWILVMAFIGFAVAGCLGS